jgi:hypothetical protein
MEAVAPAALALTVGLDAAASLGLVLMSYEGPFAKAILPSTHDARLDIAAGGAMLLAFRHPSTLNCSPQLGLNNTMC